MSQETRNNETPINPERAAIETARQQRNLARDLQQQVNQQLEETESRYKDSILALLGGSRSCSLAKCSEDILNYADSAGVDPRWLFSVVSRIADHAQPFSKPTIKDHDPQDPVSRAIHYINMGSYGENTYAKLAIPKFDQAAKLEEEKERLGGVPVERRLSVAYHWLRDNVFVLSDLHSRDFWNHY